MWKEFVAPISSRASEVLIGMSIRGRRIYISFHKAACHQFDLSDAVRADAFIGEDNHEGLIKLVFNRNGGGSIKLFSKSSQQHVAGVTASVPAISVFQNVGSQPCKQYEYSKEEDAIYIKIPDAIYGKENKATLGNVVKIEPAAKKNTKSPAAKAV